LRGDQPHARQQQLDVGRDRLDGPRRQRQRRRAEHAQHVVGADPPDARAPQQPLDLAPPQATA